MLRVSFEFETVAEAAVFLEGLGGTTQRPAVARAVVSGPDTAEPPEPSKDPAAAPTKRARRTKAEMQAAAAPPVEQPTATAPDAPTPTIDDVRDALGRVMAARGIEAASDILTRHGVNRVGLLFPSAYASVLQDCRGE